MSYSYTAKGNTKQWIDKILMKSPYSSLQNYIDSKIKSDYEFLKKYPNKSVP